MSSYRGHTCHVLDRHGIFMTASLDSAESQCIWSERHVTSCRGGQVELVVWLAQMVPAMPSILGDRSRIRTGRIWRWCRMAPPPRRVRANHCALRLCRSRLFARTSIRRDLNHLLAVSGLTDASNRPLTFTPHDFRRLFATDALRSGLPPHIAAKVLGHLDLGTTLGYAAVYSEDVVTHHRAFIARRRGLRPAEEYRDLSPEEWDQFLSHFELRKVALGTCTRDFGTPCLHEHSCIDVRCFDPTLLRHSAWSRSATTSTTASPKPAAKAGSAKSPDSRPASLPPSRSFRPHANSAPARQRSPTSACPVQRPGRNDNPPVTRDTPDSDTFPRSSTESSEKIAFQPRLITHMSADRRRPPEPGQMPLSPVRHEPPHRSSVLAPRSPNIRQRQSSLATRRGHVPDLEPDHHVRPTAGGRTQHRHAPILPAAPPPAV